MIGRYNFKTKFLCKTQQLPTNSTPLLFPFPYELKNKILKNEIYEICLHSFKYPYTFIRI